MFAGQKMLPPAHPRCACAVEYIEVEPPVFRPENMTEIETEAGLEELKEFSSGEAAEEYFGKRPDRSLRRSNREEYDRQLDYFKTQSPYGKWSQGILEAHEMSAEAVRMLKSVMRKVEGLDGEKVTVTLTNSQTYPFNNSVKTIQLKTPRNYKTYLITAEVISVSGGAVGDIEFTDKLLNGFKVAYTGSAKSVTMDLYVRGGM